MSTPLSILHRVFAFRIRQCLRGGVAGLWMTASRLAADDGIVLAHQSSPVSFRNHVESVLTKTGCNMGACHGAAAGKNGFYLSLRGYNPEADFIAIARTAGGRRLSLSDPGRSLLLLKATGTIPHKGGKRFEIDSPEYRTLADWIASGATGPNEKESRLDHLEIQPVHSTLEPGASRDLRVLATFTDGRVEDVSRWAKYSSAGETVANVDDHGTVKVVGFGEAGISAWYLSQIVTATVTVPFTNHLDSSLFDQLASRNFIDRGVNEKLRELNLPPSPPVEDGEFIRRTTLDTLGILPTLAEVKAFLADTGPDKRDRWIEALLNRPEFTDYWTYKWSDLLLVNSARLPPRAAQAYYLWLQERVQSNVPWDQIARDLFAAQGSTLENGAGNFFILHNDARQMAETATQAFMGMSVGCAKCHNHPSERWTNDDYYALANLFARLRIKNGVSDGERVLFAAATGDLVQPRTGKPQKPRPLDGDALEFDAPGDRRVAFAAWLTSKSNPYFAKAIVNRIWANFFGTGLVERVDDLRVSNPASNEKLFQAAADFLVDHRYDLKSLMREILRSGTYQRSSMTLPGNVADTRFYSHYYPRRLMAEVILDALSQVTGMPTEFKRELRNRDGFALSYPPGTRAIQLPDSLVASYFLKSFGRPERLQTCECERTSEPSVAQVLHVANGDTLNHKLSAAGNAIEQACTGSKSPDQILNEAFLTALARYPTSTEKERLGLAVAGADGRISRPAVEDLYWALLSTKEFLFNH